MKKRPVSVVLVSVSTTTKLDSAVDVVPFDKRARYLIGPPVPCAVTRPVRVSIVITLGAEELSKASVVGPGVFCLIDRGIVIVSPGITNTVSRRRFRSSGLDTATTAPLDAVPTVATTTAVPFPIPATRPDESMVATLDGRTAE